MNAIESQREKLSTRSALRGTNDDGFPYPRAFFEGVFARFCGDEAAAQSAFTRARVDVNRILQQEPAHAEALSVLGLIDAALHQKEPAIRECRHALELLQKKDAGLGGTILRNLALVYAWTGEKELALNNLQATAELPGYLNYGYLQLHPDWDPLRGDPRFEKIVALARAKTIARIFSDKFGHGNCAIPRENSKTTILRKQRI